MLSVFHNRRWDSDFLTVRGLLPRLGEISVFEASWDRFRPDIKPGWREEPGVGAGLFNDLGPHLIDQVLQLFGMPEAVDARIVTERPQAKVDDCFDVTLHYGSRRVCLRASSLMPIPRPRFAIRGSTGSFVKRGLDPQEAQLKAGMDPRSPAYGVDAEDGALTLASGSSERVPTARGRYIAFYDGLAAAVLDGASVPVPPEDARAGLALISLARRASELGQKLAVPDANSTAA
jgi:scyllo-inositol 2-dehydrogenase (NADP+)